MTTITMQLSDEIVNQAKQAGVYDERTLVDKIHQFLQMQTKQANPKENLIGQSSMYDFIMELPPSDCKIDGLEVQKKLRNEWL